MEEIVENHPQSRSHIEEHVQSHPEPIVRWDPHVVVVFRSAKGALSS
jgi:hypothetical protein